MSGADVYRASVCLNGAWFPYRLIRSSRRRRVIVTVAEDGGLEVRAPFGASSEAIEALLSSEAGRLSALLIRGRGNRQPPDRCRPMLTGRRLPFLDEQLYLVVRAGDSPRAYRDRQELWLHSPTMTADDVRTILESWYRQQAWLYLPPRLRQLAEEVGVQPTRVTIRSQKTRWGSCSTRGTISLNWRLMLVPSVLADYVLVHELCHLRHLDHSPRFWALLSTLIPNYREHRCALREATACLPF